MREERETLMLQLAAVADVGRGTDEALSLMGQVPNEPAGLSQMSIIQRTAARALLKSVEQMQDLLARTLRLLLILEEEDMTGMSARAIADRAESLGMIPSTDEWSALVRLRNRLVHEYPASAHVQLARLRDAVAAAGALHTIHLAILAFADQRKGSAS